MIFFRQCVYLNKLINQFSVFDLACNPILTVFNQIIKKDMGGITTELIDIFPFNFS